MAVSIKDFIDRLSRDLVDTKNVRWTRDELLDFINDAISAVVIRRPDLSRNTDTVSTATNTVKLPDDAYQILAVNHIDNMAVQYVDINKLNQLYPDWRKTLGSPVCWTRNSLDETTLFLYPAPSTPVDVELVYSRLLTLAAEENAVFPLPDIYIGVVADFVLYRAYGKDSANPNEANKSQLHLQAFSIALGDKNATDTAKTQVLKENERLR